MAHEDPFRPASRIFGGHMPAAEPAPTVAFQPKPAAEPAPVMQQAAPVREAAPVIRHDVETVRMPKIEDFSPVVKAEHDYRGQPQQPAPEDRGPMGLLKRLTNSLTRRDDDETSSSDAAATAAVTNAQRRQLSPEASLYAPRRGNLDDQGRQVPQARSASEDGELEIPAFLRRQSN
jgi:cell division protein FtsZ